MANVSFALVLNLHQPTSHGMRNEAQFGNESFPPACFFEGSKH
jgi:hypothetical protein